MKKKEKLFIMILFSLSLSALLTNVFGQTTYTCEAKIGDEYIYKITKLNADWVNWTGLNLGDKEKIKITDITEDTYVYTIEYDKWDFISSNESFGATADHQEWDNVFKYEYYFYLQRYPFLLYFVLSPVSTYLSEYAEVHANYSSSGNVLSINDYRVEDVIITYDSNGIASKIQYSYQYSNSTTAFYVLSRAGSSSSIPGYDLPILIGITAIASVSIIYIVKKKMLI